VLLTDVEVAGDDTLDLGDGVDSDGVREPGERPAVDVFNLEA
jgi:hypothetical protein